jgi:hypothetical protein
MARATAIRFKIGVENGTNKLLIGSDRVCHFDTDGVNCAFSMVQNGETCYELRRGPGLRVRIEGMGGVAAWLRGGRAVH